MTLKTTGRVNHGDKHWDLGETSVEYLRQVSPAWRLFLAIEGGEGGAMDEWVFVTAAQWRISNRAFLKLSNGFGVAPNPPTGNRRSASCWRFHEQLAGPPLA